MADTAGLTLFHVSHGVTDVFPHITVVAGFTADIGRPGIFFLQVLIMTEDNGAGSIGFERLVL